MKRTTNVIIILFAVYILAMLLTSCGDDTMQSPDAEQRVKTCISQGGDPKYTTDKYGYVVTFLGCVKP